MRIPLPFVGGHSEGFSPSVNTQKCVNLYPQTESRGAFARQVLYPRPGLQTLTTGGAGPIRSGGVKWNGDIYFVSGSELIKIDTSFTATSIGNLNTVSGRCSIAAGRDYIMVVDGTDGWSYDGTTYAQISDADFPTADYCTWLSDYFVVNSNGSDTWYVSAIDDPTSWDALDFATAETKPDIMYRPVAFRGNLYLLGDLTTEVYYAGTNPDFPFEKWGNGIIEWGLDAPDSVGQTKDVLLWLAKSAEGNVSVVQCSGDLQAAPVSNYDIDYQINQLSTTSDAEGFCYREDGHTFYVLTFPTGDVTYVYDMNERLWHQRKSNGIGRWGVGGYGYLNKKHIVGDYLTGQFYSLEKSVYTDNGSAIERIRRGTIVSENQQRIFWNRFEVMIEGGVGPASDTGSITAFADAGGGNVTVTSAGHGLSTGDTISITGTTNYNGEYTIANAATNTFEITATWVSDDGTGTWTHTYSPQIMLRWSDDGTNTWSSEYWRSFGNNVQYGWRPVWNRLGSSYERVFEIKVTDPVKSIIRGAFADVDMTEKA